MRKLIIIALVTMFTGCVTINKIYPVTKTDTVYITKPFFDRGIDPGFWYTPQPQLPGGPYQPFFRTPIVNDTSKSVLFISGTISRDSLKIKK